MMRKLTYMWGVLVLISVILISRPELPQTDDDEQPEEVVVIGDGQFIDPTKS
jgi:hypothetical protein